MYRVQRTGYSPERWALNTGSCIMNVDFSVILGSETDC